MPAIASNPSQQLKAKVVSHALADPLFHAVLADAGAQIATGSKSAPNEASVESLFERVLYAALRDIGIAFHPQKEMPIATRRHLAKGRTDSRIGALVIEYKQPATLSRPSDIVAAQTQLDDYLISIAAEVENDAIGFVTDGTKIAEIRVSASGLITRSAYSSIGPDSLLRLTRSIVSLQQSALTPTNLIRDFCGHQFEGVLFRLAREFNKLLYVNSTAKTEMLRTEWQELFRLAHEDDSLQRRIQERRKVLSEIFGVAISEATMEYQAIFALHTAYAIVLKFMAFRVVSDVKFGAVLQEFKPLAVAESDVLRAFCASLEDGELFRQVGILNLLEGDFFSWYTDQRQWNDEIAA